MQETSIFPDILQDSRLPTSTLRSTASPYKRVQDPSIFKAYLSQLDKCELVFPLNPKGEESSNRASINASSPNISEQSHSHEHFDIKDTKFDSENASIASSDVWLEPLGSSSPAPSSPISSIAIDTLSCPDLHLDDTTDFPDDLSEPVCRSNPDPFDEDDDAATESDYAIEPIAPSTSSLPSSSRSPFSSPLSSAPSSPVATHKVLPTKSKGRKASHKSSSDKNGEQDWSRVSEKKKRSRSPSPIPQKSKKRISKRYDDVKISANETVEAKKKKRLSSSSITAAAHTPVNTTPIQSADELVGPLVQILALSMKSSLTTSTLVQELLASLPFLQKERTLDEFTTMVVNTMSNSKVFGRAQSNGVKNADDEEVEDEWFYRPEHDRDESRREFLSEFQRGGGKRRATQQKKQYYWKPVR